ncbi:MAG: hypothetical protein WCT03_04980 [Candidatus Obscuribacterales bacterium]|jgi:hypothetical protein
MNISRYEFGDKACLILVNGAVIQAYTHTGRDTSAFSFEDLLLEFSTGSELLLRLVRNVRNTERADLIVIESESTQDILMCGGLMGYVVSPNGEIVTSFETGYPDLNAPVFEARYDFSGFDTIPMANGCALVWDYGIVFLDSEFKVLSITPKSADTVLQSVSDDELLFENGSTEAKFRISAKN